ncbi:hypothetical protein FH609_024790 [Streptomyces sp. 3MP-14]|uniref:Uncharacterized protein n=1 Tax=Streptomyces mimosae TaxID=2586635 RepID=A0A5N6A1P4_9ACTN|nr:MULTISPECIES: nucleic acid/nucleotide deaminase domain-containing protein [Streptomyces]KAB8162162.1 hypothetical protein FH607_021945 [Streptomyces mimosae]KAB8173940.1 hypothetical protein FH609_024790 [Streptomyces sp. 3MP-14]
MAGLGQRIARPVINILEEIASKVPRGMDRAHRQTARRIRRAADRFDESERRLADRVPTYTVDDEGNVRRLMPNGRDRPVRWWDPPSVRRLLGEDRRTAVKKEDDEYNLSNTQRERRRVTSEQTDWHRGELTWATQRARLAANDRDGNNYAAYRYEGDDGDFILVGKSYEENRTHSEHTAGIPFDAARDRLDGWVTGLHSERAPCHGRGMRQCDQWVGTFMQRPQEELPVTNSVPYGDTPAQRRLDNKVHKAYRDWLFGE